MTKRLHFKVLRLHMQESVQDQFFIYIFSSIKKTIIALQFIAMVVGDNDEDFQIWCCITMFELINVSLYLISNGSLFPSVCGP